MPELTNGDVAFPARALDWMPPMNEIPERFKTDKAQEIVDSWFSLGLSAKVEFYSREGVDPEAAVRALQATLGSYAPKHEHKMAAAAYMLDAWFSKVKHWKRS